ncbi:hypothetical protein BgiMline_020827 [Biomphalaria glabrata]|nr:hypothetical protein BgiMline_018008 [Biomphalaria glabrata]
MLVSHLEANRPKTIISTRTTTTIGTMQESEKTEEVAAEMKRYNLTILGISESRWSGFGQKRLTSVELLLYSEHEQEAKHTQEVALMLSKQAQRALIGWEVHGPRIIIALFQQCRKGLTKTLSNAMPQQTTVKRRTRTLFTTG